MKSADVLTNECLQWTKIRFDQLNKKKALVGISGGADSTVVAMLLVKALGKENVIGIMMPNGKQKDISDSIRVVEALWYRTPHSQHQWCFQEHYQRNH